MSGVLMIAKVIQSLTGRLCGGKTLLQCFISSPWNIAVHILSLNKYLLNL